ncbi:MAG: hypothetical protein V4592_04555 [Bacteroidota bacterium]
MSLSYIYQGDIVPASTLIPITAGLIYYRQLNKPLRTLLAYLCIALLINIAGIIMANNGKNNLPLLHFYTMFELLAVMLYYKYAFADKKMDKWIYIIMILYPIFCVVNFTFFQSIKQFNTYTRPLEAIIIIVFSGIYLAGHEANDKQSFANAGRWVASGFMVYLCSSLFQFIFSNVISHNAPKQIKMIIWNLHATFVLMMYIFFFVAMMKHERSKR